MKKFITNGLLLAVILFTQVKGQSNPGESTLNSCSQSHYFEKHICGGDSVLFDQKWRKAEGLYEATFTDSKGCDSIVRLQVWHMPTSFTQMSLDLCEGSKLIIDGFNIDAPGVYILNYTASWGCDSTVQIQVNAKKAAVTKINKTLCSKEVFYFNNQEISSAGIYEARFASSLGCDSVVQLNVEKIDLQTNVLREEDGLAAGVIADGYQWMICPSYIPIPGATKSRLALQNNGTYALQIDYQGCRDTSECISTSTNGFAQELEDKGYTVYPNPASEKIQVHFNTETSGTLTLYTLSGAVARVSPIQQEFSREINLSDLPKGAYLMVIHTLTGTYRERILVQ